MSWFRKTRVPHPAAPDIYEYALGRIPSVGTDQFIFESRLGNPVYTFKGIGGRLNGTLRMTTPLLLVNPAAVPSGLGGIQNGQIAFQPLLDTTIQQSS